MNSWQSRPWYTGSSPRMRGALTWVPDTHAESRIIHADAGSTFLSFQEYCQTWDHPRGCGEHPTRDEMEQMATGSSLRMRGTSPAWTAMTEAKPRGCGEHEQKQNRVLQAKGSSPRMRGAQKLSKTLLIYIRIIPADAGSTCWQVSGHRV